MSSAEPRESEGEEDTIPRASKRRERAEAETLATPSDAGKRKKKRGKKAKRKRGARRHPDIEIARLLVKRGYVGKEAAVEALRSQKARAKAGKARVPFLRQLVKNKVLAATRVPEAQDEIRRNTYLCEACNARAVILAGSQSRAGACPRCGHQISVDPPTDPDAVPVREFTADDEATDPMSTGGGTDDWRPLGSRYRRRLPLGEVAFERFLVQSELGRGAMGVVYKAQHMQLGKAVALKVLFPEEDSWEHQVARFRREAAAVQKLRHEHIVAIHDFGSDGEVYYLTMDLVPGGESLHTRLKDFDDPAPLRWRVEALAQVARAASHAHQMGVIHRDLKPANILIHPEKGPMVADFGLAKDEDAEVGELTRTHDRLGTPLFMAPEQIRKGASTVDQRADVWAMGVMLFVCVTGRYPFRSRTVMDLYLRILREPPDWFGDKYSAPDRQGFYGPPKSPDSEATGASTNASSASTPGTSATQISARDSGGELPKSVPRDRALGSGVKVIAPAPFTTPPELTGRDVPADLRAILNCALAKDPDDRYPTADAFADDLEAFLAGRKVQGGGPGLLKRFRQQFWRRRVLRPLALSMAVLAVCVGIFSALAYRQREAELQLDGEVESAWAQAVGGGEEGYAMVEATLSGILRRAPEHPRALLRRGLAHLWQLEFEEAEADLQQAEQRAASAARDPETLYLEVGTARARLDLLRKRDTFAYRRALAALDAYSRDGSFGTRSDAVEALVLAAINMNDPDAQATAEARCGTICADARAAPHLHAFYGRLALARGDVALARKRLERGELTQEAQAGESGVQVSNLELLLLEAAILHGEGQRASSVLQQEKRAFPTQATPEIKYLSNLSLELYRDRNWVRNVAVNEAIARLSPWSGRVCYFIGNAQLNGLHDFDKALDAFRRAAERNPYESIHRDFYLALLSAPPADRELLSEAARFLQRDAERLRPDSASPLVRLAYVYIRQDELVQAWKSFDRADERIRGGRQRAKGLRSSLGRACIARIAREDQLGALRKLGTWSGDDPDELERAYFGPTPYYRYLDALEVGRIYLERGMPARTLGLVEGIKDVPLPDSLGRSEDRLKGARWALDARAQAASGRVSEALSGLRRACSGSTLPPMATPKMLELYPELDAVRKNPGYASLIDGLRVRRGDAGK